MTLRRGFQLLRPAGGRKDVYEVNPDFVHPMRKLKLQAVAVRPANAKSEAELLAEELQGMRRQYVDAAIVRIMKARRQLLYTDCRDRVVDTCSRVFTPSDRLIRKCIDDLITNEYLRRDDDNPKMLHYLA
jgi:transposase InsO family protein